MLTEATRKTRTIGYFLERSFLLDERGFHFFLFSFHGESLTIFEKREKEREIILESFRGWHSSSSNEGRRMRIEGWIFAALHRSLKLRK